MKSLGRTVAITGLVLATFSYSAFAGGPASPMTSVTSPLAPFLIPVAAPSCTTKCNRQEQQCKGSCGPQITCKTSCKGTGDSCRAACK